MAECDIIATHPTVMRWVLRYVPEYKKTLGSPRPPWNSSWRMYKVAIRNLMTTNRDAIRGRYSMAAVYLLAMPNGGRFQRYNYRFGGKPKTVAFGIHPDVSLEKARARHQVARSRLPDGIDPSAREPTFRKITSRGRQD